MNLNKFIIIGRIGKKPTLSKTKGGDSYCVLMVITNTNFIDSNKISRSNSDAHYINFFSKNAINLCKFSEVGQSILVIGKIKRRKNEIRREETVLYGEKYQPSEKEGRVSILNS
ncbi:MAG: single-stranded DNA-binding protein [Candidatus Paceibacterota bacterium]